MRSIPRLTLAASAAALAACAEQSPTGADLAPGDAPVAVKTAASGPLDFGATPMIGTFTDDAGTEHTVQLLLDLVSYRNGDSHKAWLKPEDYKLVRPTFSAAGQQITCPEIAGPGLKAISAGTGPVVECTWKNGTGSAPSGSFSLVRGGSLSAALPLFKSFRARGKTIVGGLTHLGTTYTLRLDLDVADYRNGTSHKAYLKPEGYSVDRGGYTGQLNCPTDGPGTKLVSAGAAPALTCTWKVGNGAQPPENQGTVTLQ